MKMFKSLALAALLSFGLMSVPSPFNHNQSVVMTSAFADEGAAVAVAAAPVLAPPVLVDPNADALAVAADAFKKIMDSKAAGTLALIMAIITILIGVLKNSALRGYFWDKLGWFKVLLAPALGMIYCLLAVKQAGSTEYMAAMLMGFGSTSLHELLDGIKQIPGLGPTYVAVIDIVGGILGNKKA